MMLALVVGAVIIGGALLATIAFSRDWLASGIRGTVRGGVLGFLFFIPIALLLAAFCVLVYAVVASIGYVLDLAK